MPEFDYTDYGPRYALIPDFPGYRVGTDGSVWGSRKTGRWQRLRPSPGTSKRLTVSFSNGSGVRHYRLVHRLVLAAFVGPCPDGMEACHFPDIDPNNNNLANLRWGTKSENCADRLFHGNDTRGEKNKRAKLKRDDVLFIRKNASMFTRQELANRFGVSKRTVQFIIYRRNWAWL